MRGTAAGIADAVDENILYKSLFRLCLVRRPGVRARRAVFAALRFYPRRIPGHYVIA
jgi:hypothetical protein